jgi:hypothetical protein
MSDRPVYLLDADTLIRAKREHYAPDFCPGFWDGLLLAFRQGRLISIQVIREELLRGNDALANWVRDEVPADFFISVENEAVEAHYRRILAWAEQNSQFTRAAKQKFARSADPWLVAVAAANGYVVVTYEVSKPEAKAFIQLPDVAREFNVKCIPPYVMLRELGIVLKLEEQSAR